VHSSLFSHLFVEFFDALDDSIRFFHRDSQGYKEDADWSQSGSLRGLSARLVYGALHLVQHVLYVVAKVALLQQIKEFEVI
jgi:hypothetical protein